VQSKNIISSLIIGLIDGIRNPLIFAGIMTLLLFPKQRFDWVFLLFVVCSGCVMALGHWFTIQSENKSATGESLQKEKEIYQNIGLKIQDETEPARKPDFVSNAVTPSLQVGFFYLLGGLIVYIPFLVFSPLQKAMIISICISTILLLICGYAKARYYRVNPWMEALRTTLLPLIVIGLAYGILKLF
jgi:VIT1/CCC1 family predicted Fe2+/Mn2+ transporter